MNRKWARRLGDVLTGVLLAGALAGCSLNAGGRLGELKQLASSCPPDKRPAALVALDVRQELRGTALQAARLRAVGRSAAWVAVCGGRLRVEVFSASAVASVVVWDGVLAPSGATENARLRRVDGLVKKTMGTIAAVLPLAVARVSSRGGDPVGQVESVAEYAGELGSGFTLHALIESSGFTGSLPPVGLNRARAARLAEAVRVPALSGVASLTFAGLGRVGAGAPPPSETVAALQVFYLRLCERERARECRATSDVDPVGA